MNVTKSLTILKVGGESYVFSVSIASNASLFTASRAAPRYEKKRGRPRLWQRGFAAPAKTI